MSNKKTTNQTIVVTKEQRKTGIDINSIDEDFRRSRYNNKTILNKLVTQNRANPDIYDQIEILKIVVKRLLEITDNTSFVNITDRQILEDIYEDLQTISLSY